MRIFLLIPLLLAGCGIFGDGNSPRAQCERDANKDPAVAAIELKQFSATPNEPNLHPDLVVARHEAVERCLQARGLAPAGGVEPVRPRY